MALALVGWCALVFAMLVLVRPTARVMAAGLVGGLGLALVWGVQMASATHSPTAATIVRLVLAAGVGVVSGALLARPELGSRWDTSTSGCSRSCPSPWS